MTKLQTIRRTRKGNFVIVYGSPRPETSKTVAIISMRYIRLLNKMTIANACSMRENPFFEAFVSPADGLNYIFLLNCCR